MAIYSARVSVSTVAVRLDADVITGAPVRRSILIRNRGTAAVFLGPPGVTTATGYQLDAGESLGADTFDDLEPLYGIAAAGSHECHILQVGSA